MSARKCQVHVPESQDRVEHRRCDRGPVRFVAIRIRQSDLCIGVWLCDDHDNKLSDEIRWDGPR